MGSKEVNQSGGVMIGDVEGGIHRSTIAGRDVIETTIDQLVHNVFEDSTQFQEQRDRAEVLALMKRIWITNVLNRAPPGPAQRTPIFEVRPDAVSNPWQMIVDASVQTRELLPAGTTIVDLFLTMGGSLLLLGEPGTGKTSVLLELARQAIAWAEEDPTQPIPVVLDLGWWADGRQKLSAWLLNLLQHRYCIPSELARAWLKNDELALLLDGLDKVAPPKRREACVQAINDLRQEHGLMPIVVCCRTIAYEALQTRLQLQGAVCLHRSESLQDRDVEDNTL